MRYRPIHPVLLGLVGAYTLAGGYVHLQQWLDGYNHVPTQAPGWWVVRVGFLVSAATSAVLAIGLVASVRYSKTRRLAVAGAIGFATASLGVLIATRVGSVFGWSEPVWTSGANQARAVEIGVLLLGVVALATTMRPFAARRQPLPV